MKDIIYIAAIAVLILLSGERQQDLRRRLEAEQQFSEALATEINLKLERIIPNGKQ
jgi:uncharacterized membrane protein